MSLRQGLEALYTFDSDHIDQGAGVAKDFSGKERHATASGGPTYNQPSPVGEGVGFDGTDDRFDNKSAKSNAGQSQVTVACLCRWDGGNSGTGKYAFMHGGFSVLINHGGTDAYKTVFSTPNGSVTLNHSGFPLENEWVTIITTFDAGEARLFVNGDLVDIDTTTETTIQDKKATELAVGSTVNASAPFSGDLAFVAEWFRTLSDAEISQLNRMTDRMVSRL